MCAKPFDQFKIRWNSVLDEFQLKDAPLHCDVKSLEIGGALLQPFGGGLAAAVRLGRQQPHRAQNDPS